MTSSTSRAVEIVQITDAHLGASEDFMLKGINTAETLSQVLAAVSQTPYDWLIATGDISDDFSHASYALFLRMLDQHGISSLICLSGNHDDPAVMQQILQPVALPTIFFDGDWLFICLNTTLANSDEGEVTETDLARLNTLLTQHAQKHVAIFMHHHVVPVQSRWIDAYRLRNHSSFMKHLARYNNVRAVISGHVHQASISPRNGATFYTSPATSLQFVPGCHLPKISTVTASWRKWTFWPDGKVSDQLFSLKKKAMRADEKI
ncbi:metallophosphoesterase [Acerihabitans sp. KWT182]|uniref:Metallophosphoesterase n=1 Tax=Acerihabitans sp. KWT182 TaxID=3157919 RepID=A0AAU7Q7K8_9GAMM